MLLQPQTKRKLPLDDVHRHLEQHQEDDGCHPGLIISSSSPRPAAATAPPSPSPLIMHLDDDHLFFFDKKPKLCFDDSSASSIAMDSPYPGLLGDFACCSSSYGVDFQQADSMSTSSTPTCAAGAMAAAQAGNGIHGLGHTQGHLHGLLLHDHQHVPPPPIPPPSFHVSSEHHAIPTQLNSFYDASSFCKLPLCDDVGSAEQNQLLASAEEPADSDCYSSCPTSLVPTSARTDPSLDPEFFEFGTVHIPVSLQHGDAALRDIFRSCNRLSLELFAYHS